MCLYIIVNDFSSTAISIKPSGSGEGSIFFVMGSYQVKAYWYLLTFATRNFRTRVADKLFKNCQYFNSLTITTFWKLLETEQTKRQHKHLALFRDAFVFLQLGILACSSALWLYSLCLSVCPTFIPLCIIPSLFSFLPSLPASLLLPSFLPSFLLSLPSFSSCLHPSSFLLSVYLYGCTMSVCLVYNEQYLPLPQWFYVYL